MNAIMTSAGVSLDTDEYETRHQGEGHYDTILSGGDLAEPE